MSEKSEQDEQLEVKISDAKADLDSTRKTGDTLRTALAEAALNDLLERYTCHTYHT